MYWLCQRAASFFQFIFFCFTGNKVHSASETRTVEVGFIDPLDKKKHNKIKTSKYSLLLFIPKNLSEQFRRVVNFYFLIVTLIAFLIESPVSPFTSVLPLSFVVLVTAVKQGFEDYLRHKEDKKVNNQVVDIVHKGVIKKVTNSSIAPGTLVRVGRGKEVPADLVLLCSADVKGKCFVTTANLDGETNLKTLRVPPPLVGYTADILPQGIQIEIPNPIADLYTFYGRLNIPGQDTIVLSTDNLMLRGSRVKNTDWAIGCAIYTGEETKLALNSKYTGNKFSSCESAMNSFLLVFILLLMLMILISYAAKIIIESVRVEKEAYLGPAPPLPPSVRQVFQDMFSFLLLYYYIIPMSLYVTIELNKYIGTYFFTWDADLRCEETGKPAMANTSDLNEDLGQIEVLFSDKTGTLTKNLMVFKACSIKGHVYEERDGKLYSTEGFEHPMDYTNNDVKFFFTILALCHSVQISSDDMKKLSARLSLTPNILDFFKRKKNKTDVLNGTAVNGGMDNGTWNSQLSDNGSKMDYQGSSPDEKALVEAACRVGITFLGEDGNDLLLKIGEHTEMYEKLQVLEFTSERKRMSVIVRDKNGKIWLFCKGAESSIFPICKNSVIMEDTDRDVNEFANKGLRTLAVAYREIPEEEYRSVVDMIRTVDVTDAETLQQVSQQYRMLERQLTLAGATAVEDCLQDDVADTIASLRRAGIKIWVLTGDKVETAINVAQSCAHISDSDRRMFLVGIKNEDELITHLAECTRIMNEPSYKDLTLIIDGASVAQILDTSYAKIFVEITMNCHAILCCRLSPIQKAKIVKMVKECPQRPLTAAIGDGANDISMIQEAHVGFGIFGREGHQAARSADFAFTKFSMLKKIILVLGHWYYQRLTTLILYFFYKNLILGNIMFFFQIHCAFSTQSVYDSMFLTVYNLVPTSVPCLVLSLTEQRFPPGLLINNPMLYRHISRNRLLSWWRLGGWCVSAAYHSLAVYAVTAAAFYVPVINDDMNTVDLWSFGAMLFHLMVLIVSLKLWLHARYHTLILVSSIVLSVLVNVATNVFYASFNFQYDGDVLGTYTRLIVSLPFWLANVLVVVAALAPDFCARLVSDYRFKRTLLPARTQTTFSTRL
ncbi:hypothetical protein evm_005699 [Chilo suppressalis]|nr:hypothetical protein evm_005699 [Chilo suppressalis]